MRPPVFRLFTRFYHRDLDHPVTIIQLAKGLAYLVLWPKGAKALNLADRDGRRFDDCLHVGFTHI